MAPRRIRFWVFYVAYLAVFFALLNTAVHWRYYRRLRAAARVEPAPTKPPLLDALTAGRLGRLAPPRTGSFALASRAKTPGTIRIGCFGDSYTYGSEVDDVSAYCHILQQTLRDHGFVRVEALNFGNPSFGFHQTNMMFELVGRDYDLDYALILPFPEYWRDRDVSFAYWPPGGPWIGVHARYVLRRSGLELIDVAGDSELERFERYNALIPPMRYLRHDARAPAFMRAWLPDGRELPNPFYRRHPGGLAGEVDEIYRRILLRLASIERPRVIVIDAAGDLAPLLAPAAKDQLVQIAVSVPTGFPYRMPNQHYAPWAHRLLAEHVARAFGVERDRPIAAIRIFDLNDVSPSGAHVRPNDVVEIRSVSVEIEDRRVGTLMQFDPGKTYRSSKTLPADVRYLVIVPISGKPVVDGLVLGLPERPADAQVTAEENGFSRPLRSRLQEIGPMVARLDLCSAAAWAGTATFAATPSCALGDPREKRSTARRLLIRVGGAPVLGVALHSAGIAYEPAGAYYRFAAIGSGVDGPETFTGSGSVSLSIIRAGRAPIRVRIGSWGREDVRAGALPALDLRDPP